MLNIILQKLLMPTGSKTPSWPFLLLFCWFCSVLLRAAPPFQMHKRGQTSRGGLCKSLWLLPRDTLKGRYLCLWHRAKRDKVSFCLSLQLIYPPTCYANKDKSSISVCITVDGLCMQHYRNSFKKDWASPKIWRVWGNQKALLYHAPQRQHLPKMHLSEDTHQRLREEGTCQARRNLEN